MLSPPTPMAPAAQVLLSLKLKYLSEMDSFLLPSSRTQTTVINCQLETSMPRWKRGYRLAPFHNKEMEAWEDGIGQVARDHFIM